MYYISKRSISHRLVSKCIPMEIYNTDDRITFTFKNLLDLYYDYGYSEISKKFVLIAIINLLESTYDEKLYISNETDVLINLVRYNGELIQYMKHPPKEVQSEAVRGIGGMIKVIKMPDGYIRFKPVSLSDFK